MHRDSQLWLKSLNRGRIDFLEKDRDVYTVRNQTRKRNQFLTH